MKWLVLLTLSLALPGQAVAQTRPAQLQTAGTVVTVSVVGEVRHPNDEARATFMLEEQDRDKAAAASRANQKMAQGMQLLRRADPQAVLKTRGYYTYPVYADEQAQPRQQGKARQPAGWRVGQYLDVTTRDLRGLPATVAAAQSVLALSELRFGLTQDASKKLEEALIAATYRNLQERIAAIAKAMERNVSDALLDSIDLDGGAVYPAQHASFGAKTMRGAARDGAPVEEPSFEAGDTALNLRALGKLRFK